MIDTVTQVERIIRNFWASAPSNSLHLETGEKDWALPHVAIAQGDDPLFLRNKAMIGLFLRTPEEAYALAFPHDPAPAGELRVIRSARINLRQSMAGSFRINSKRIPL